MIRPVVGVDLSLASTGVAWLPDCVSLVKTTADRYRGRGGEESRLNEIVDRVLYLVDDAGASARPDGLVVVEGLKLGGPPTGQAYTRAGLHYLLRCRLMSESAAALLIVPPATLKLFVTGRGNADKHTVTSTVAVKLGRALASSDSADALALVAFGCAYAGQGSFMGELSSKQQQAVTRFRERGA